MMRSLTRGIDRTPHPAQRPCRTGKGQGDHVGRPPYVGPSRVPGKFSRLHRAICMTFRMHNVTGLSSSSMEEYFQRAVSAHTPEDVKYFYLLANVFKRYQASDAASRDLRIEAAVNKLLDSEERCKWTNQVFAGGLCRSNALIPLHLLPKLRRAAAICRRILGQFRLDELPRACGFTPGATTEFRRKDGVHHNKWARAAHMSGRVIPYYLAFQRWANIPQPPREIVQREANVVFTVPKNFDRDRTACKPVTWNGFFQKGAGTMIRRRLRREGLLLPDAQQYHGCLAKVASAFPGLVTRDLASASDTIAVELVDALLPPSWSKVLMDFREQLGTLPDGRIIRWEKISSMGNGFTFELETLVFYALVRACCRKDSLVTVYGDDLMFPGRYSDSVDELLAFCGFEVNRSKSFGLDSDFRESCGGHYWRGLDMKPFYITRMPQTLGDVINLHNDVVRWVGDCPRPGHFLHDVWRFCREIVPRVYWGPVGTQGVLWADWDDAIPTYWPDYQAFRVGMISFVPRSQDLGQLEPPSSFTLETREPEWGPGTSVFGAYLQKLWCVDPLPWESTETSTYKSMTDKEVRTWAYVDRAQWKGMRCVSLI